MIFDVQVMEAENVFKLTDFIDLSWQLISFTNSNLILHWTWEKSPI